MLLLFAPICKAENSYKGMTIAVNIGGALMFFTSSMALCKIKWLDALRVKGIFGF